MSGIVGVFQRDGAPVDRPMVCALTKFLLFRGPDAQEVWCDGSRRTSAVIQKRPARVAGCRSLAASRVVRSMVCPKPIDCRGEFIETLRQAGCEFDGHTITDPELILHAYANWREDCVHHLRGDFAFALWDAVEKKLFCARDHFGIKPFFYSASEHRFL